MHFCLYHKSIQIEHPAGSNHEVSIWVVHVCPTVHVHHPVALLQWRKEGDINGVRWNYLFHSVSSHTATNLVIPQHMHTISPLNPWSVTHNECIDLTSHYCKYTFSSWHEMWRCKKRMRTGFVCLSFCLFCVCMCDCVYLLDIIVALASISYCSKGSELGWVLSELYGSIFTTCHRKPCLPLPHLSPLKPNPPLLLPEAF